MKHLIKPTKLRTPHIVLILVGLAIIGLTAWYVVHAVRAADSIYGSIRNDEPLTDNGRARTSDTSTSKPAESTNSSTQADTQPTFNFVDTTGWTEQRSSDGAFTIKYKSGWTYRSCPDIADNIMIGVVSLLSDDTPCGSVQKATTNQPDGPNTIALRTQTMIAQTDEQWDRDDTKPVTVTLAGGQTAERYLYVTVVNGESYYTTEYSTTYASKRYIAINNALQGGRQNLSIDDFDTIIQKTWLFK